jgi:hypothetical protein
MVTADHQRPFPKPWAGEKVSIVQKRNRIYDLLHRDGTGELLSRFSGHFHHVEKYRRVARSQSLESILHDIKRVYHYGALQ